VTEVVQARLRQLPIVNDDDEIEFPPPHIDGSVLEGVLMGRPRLQLEIPSHVEAAADLTQDRSAPRIPAGRSVGRGARHRLPGRDT